MLNINRIHHINGMLLSTILIAITSTFTISLDATSSRVVPHYLTHYVRLEKMKNRLATSYSNDKSSKKIVDYALDIREEIESNFGLRFEIEKVFLEVEYELDRAGVAISQADMDAIKHYFHKREKKFDHKSSWDLPVSQEDEFEFTELGVVVKKKKTIEEKEHKISRELLYGVTMALAGEFFMILPAPDAKEWGSHMIDNGIKICSNVVSAKKE